MQTSLGELAREKFNLDLRVGSIPVSEIHAEGSQIEVARFALASGRSIAVFRGGGMMRADEILKSAQPHPNGLRKNNQQKTANFHSKMFDNPPFRVCRASRSYANYLEQ